MKITELSIRNPLVVTSVALALCLFGLFSYGQLEVATTPKLSLAGASVVTVYPGADPETVETNVTKPLEDAIATLPNVDRTGFVSTSSAGLSVIIVNFTEAADASMVGVDVQRVVNAARGQLPGDVEVPTVAKFDIDQVPSATIVISGSLPLRRLHELAESVVQPRLNAVRGVASVSLSHDAAREIQVLVDEEQLRARGLSINGVVGALQSQQLEVPAGSITQGSRDLSVYFDSLATSPERLGDIVVAQSPGGAVFLRDVARIEDGTQRRFSITRVDGREGISLVVLKLPGASTIQVVDGVNAALKELEGRLPAGVRLDLVVDQSTYTRKSFGTVQKALIEAVFITGLILLLFLHTWRSTLIVLVSIPISILTTLVAMSVLNYNLNLLTMIALTVSVGILVDDSIVVLENIYRHLRLGKSPFQAAIDGRNEIGLAAITITLVDVVVYLPMAVMVSGIARQFLAPFALVITIATLASLVVSFTMTPLLARHLLPRGDLTARRSLLARFGRAWDRGFLGLEHGYERLLRASLPRRWAVIALGLASFAAGASLMVFGFIGSDFFPSGDQSEIDLQLTMPAATSLAATEQVAAAVERELRGFPEVRTVYTTVGNGGEGMASASHQAQIAALLVTPHERAVSAAQLSETLRRHFDGRYPGAKIGLSLPSAFGGGFGGAPIQVQVQGSDPATLDALAAQVEAAVRSVPDAVEVQSSSSSRQTQLRATIDWTRAADLGVTARDAGVALRTAIDGYSSNQIQLRQTGKAAVPIRVLRDGSAAMSPADIARVPVSGASGAVELGQFTTLRTAQIPNAITHVDRLRSITIGANTGGGKLVGDLQKDVARAVAGVPVPAGYSVAYGGRGAGDDKAFTDLFRALGVGMLLMYMLMLMLFGSVVRPLAVMMSLPLAVVGALGGLALTHNPFTIFSMLGIMVLAGLVGKNAILLVDYTDRLRSEGYDRTAALLKAGPTRLRPIVMTTVSVMAALLPIASGLEEGSELLVSVAVVLIGGLLTSTLLTLVFVPAMYTIFDDLERAVKRLFGRREPTLQPAPAATPMVAVAAEVGE